MHIIQHCLTIAIILPDFVVQSATLVIRHKGLDFCANKKYNLFIEKAAPFARFLSNYGIYCGFVCFGISFKLGGRSAAFSACMNVSSSVNLFSLKFGFFLSPGAASFRLLIVLTSRPYILACRPRIHDGRFLSKKFNNCIDSFLQFSYKKRFIIFGSDHFSGRIGDMPFMEEAEMKQRLESMQRELVVLVEQTGSFVDPKVVKLSQKIDRIVLAMQRKRMQRKIK